MYKRQSYGYVGLGRDFAIQAAVAAVDKIVVVAVGIQKDKHADADHVVIELYFVAE